MGWLKGRMDNAFGIVNQHLVNRAFMVGDQPTMADFSQCGYMFYPLEESGYDVAASYPTFMRGRSACANRPDGPAPTTCCLVSASGPSGNGVIGNG